MLYVNNPPPPQTSAPLVENVRTDVRTRIYEILRRRLRSDASMDTKCLYDVTTIIEERLFQSAESFEDYSDFQSLQQRVLSLLDHFKRNLNRCRLQDATSTSLGGPQQTSTPLQANHTTSFTPINGGVSIDMQRRPQSTNLQVANIYTPNMNQVTSGPQGISLPLANGPKTPPQELFTATHLSQPNHLQASPQMHRYSIRNVDSRVSSIVATSSGSIAVSRDLVPFNLTQLSQQLSNHDVHKKSGDIERQGLQSQKLYPSQLQMGTGLAAPLKQGPSLTLYKEARERQATNGITPTKLQYQHTDVKDHYIGVQSAFVRSSTQPNSSPYFRPHPHQKQSTSIMVQGHSSQQKATEIPENNNVAPISVQTVERKRLPDGKDTSSKQVNEDCGQKDVKARRWLLFMHHVRGCTATEGNCDSKFCFKGKMLLKHIEGCMVPDCTYHLCLCTRKWMSHYNHCKDKSCPVCVYVKNFKQKEKSKRLLLLRGDKCSSASQPMRSSESSQGYNKRRAEAPSVDDDLLPSNKRMKIGRPSENAIPETRCGVVCKPHSPMDMQEKDGVQSDGCKSVENAIPEMKNISASGPMQSSESRERHNIRGVEAPSVDDDPEPSIKRQKIERPSENAIPETKSISVTGCGVCKPHLPMDMQEKDGVQSDGCKSVENAIPEMNISASGPMQSSKSRERDNIRGVETPFVDDDPEPSIKRQKTERPSEITIPETNSISVTGCGVVCKPHSPMDMQEKDGVQSDGCKSVEVEVKYMDIDASKMEISSLVELFTPEQVKEHISSLHQWEGQSKTKADKNKAKGCSKSENACQLCDVEMLLFEQIPHYCSHCSVRIKKNVWHYSVAAGESRHYVCTACYNKEREDSVSIDGDCIPKTKFEKNKNDEETEEKWVQCDKCKAWQHQICALFNSRRNRGEATKYTCPNCYIEEVEQGERKPLPPSAILGAKDLPDTALSNHIEERLFEKLKMEREERARLQQKTYDEVPGAESITVRVVASVDKVSEVKERFFELFREENYPSNFPYKSKAILLFQKIENVEVCLFGMFVQEYGTESGSPNERRVYISYLDSVKYFRPEVRTVSGEALRTFVYHEILIGYLDYCKKRGFTSCYIWACPPRKGDDYILYCHPEIQKTPKTDKLREWYLAMLKKASKEDVVAEWTNLYDHLFVQSGECKANVTATRVPYYDGDYWPRAAEDIIREMSQEDNKTELNRKVLTKKLAPKRDLRSSDHLDLSVTASKDLLMMQKFGQIICPKKEDFIMVHLQHCCHHCSTLMISGNRWVCKQCKNFQICEKCNKVEQNLVAKERHPKNQRNKHKLFPVAVKDVPTKIEDKDDNLESVLFETRQAFLSLCQGNNYQYDTLRRAKYSSMMLLYHLHNPTSPKFVPICTICNEEVENSQGWHCEVCPAYDVCNTCYSEESFNHSHNLISRSSSTDNVVTDQNMQTTQNGQTKLEKFIASLVHVTECRSTQCQYLGCQQTKKLCRHCIACKIGPGDCVHCKKFWTLIKIHSRRCRDSECNVPKCREFKAIESSCSQIKKGIEVLCGGN